jgi:nucleoside-diphosphate-sugar epimerase
MKRVLLTGATGLIGKYAIQPLLNLGFEVFFVSSKEGMEDTNGKWKMENGKCHCEKPCLQGDEAIQKKSYSPHLHCIKANLLDFSDIKKVFDEVKPDYLLHFAWDTTPGEYLESNVNFDWVQASLEMLKQFKLYGGKRAVFAGTCFEYEFVDEPLNETKTKLHPTSTYAKCKNHLNSLATLYSEKNDISFGWGRIFYVYGENEHPKRLVPHVINSLREGKEVTITAGELRRDYMFAGDIAGGFVAFLDSDTQGCVNICTGEAPKIKEIVDFIAEKLDKKHLVKYVDDSANQPQLIVGDKTRLSNEVKFTPEYTLFSGLEKVLMQK